METTINKTSLEDQKIACSAIARLKEVSNTLNMVSDSAVKIQVQESDEVVSIPKKAFSLLLSILSTMSEGKSMRIIPTNTELSTQQAADLLNMSRPHLVKLLENNTIPFKKVGSHRRVLLKDLVAYENGLQQVREKQLKFLSEQAQNLHLGYE